MFPGELSGNFFEFYRDNPILNFYAGTRITAGSIKVSRKDGDSSQIRMIPEVPEEGEMQCHVCGSKIIGGECRCLLKDRCKTCGTEIVYITGKGWIHTGSTPAGCRELREE